MNEINKCEKTETPKKGIKRTKKLRMAVFILSALLIISVCIIIAMAVRLNTGSIVGNAGSVSTESDSIDFSAKYNELLIENEKLKEQLADALNSAEADESKAEYEAKITELEETIEANAVLMEDLGIGEDGAVSDPAILSEAYIYTKTKWNILDNYKLTESGNQISSGFIRVNPGYYYCAYSPSGNVSVTSYSEDYATLETVKGDASSGYYMSFDDKSYYIKITFPAADKKSALLVSTGIKKDGNEAPLSRRAFYVVSKNSPVSLSPSSAVNKVLSGGTVLILPGTYIDQISASSKAVNLVGVGSSKCIIQSNSCDYYTPPLEIAAGTVSNLSFKAVNNNSAITELKAYGIHVDYDYSYGRTLTISGCVITSDFNSGIGIGLRGNGTLRLSGCVISGADRGLFLHDCDRADFGGNQNLIIESCDITGAGTSPAIHLHSQAMSNANVSLTFTNNTLRSGGSLVACTNQVQGTYDDSWNNLQNYHLVTGYGNNAAEMNQ